MTSFVNLHLLLRHYPRRDGRDPAAAATIADTSGFTQSTLPDEAVEQLAGNTYAVMTSHAAQHGEWRAILSSTREDYAGRGVYYQIEVVFVDALLSILDSESPALLVDNPYSWVIQQVIDAIAEYRRENDS
jgi:class 3 adenylate cyclase